MEITYTRPVSFSLTFKPGELADHLDITVRELNRLVRDAELMSEYGDQVMEFVEAQSDSAEESDFGDIDIEDVIA